jgi:hypothetical protein
MFCHRSRQFLIQECHAVVLLPGEEIPAQIFESVLNRHQTPPEKAIAKGQFYCSHVPAWEHILHRPERGNDRKSERRRWRQGSVLGLVVEAGLNG